MIQASTEVSIDVDVRASHITTFHFTNCTQASIPRDIKKVSSAAARFQLFVGVLIVAHVLQMRLAASTVTRDLLRFRGGGGTNDDVSEKKQYP